MDQYINFWWAWNPDTSAPAETITVSGLDTNLVYDVRLYSLFPYHNNENLTVALNGTAKGPSDEADRWTSAATPFKWNNVAVTASGELVFSLDSTGADDGSDNPILNAIVIDAVEPVSIPAIGDISISQLAGTNAVVITWATGDGFSYMLLDRSDLMAGDWATNTTIVGNGGNVSVTTDVNQAKSFYRVEGE